MSSLDQTEIWSLANLGHRFLERGRLNEAQKIFAGLTTLAPDMSYPWHALGLIAKDRGNLDRAIGCFKRAQQLDPQDLDVIFNLASAQILAGQRAEARGALAQVINQARSRGDSASVARARSLMSRIR